MGNKGVVYLVKRKLFLFTSLNNRSSVVSAGSHLPDSHDTW